MNKGLISLKKVKSRQCLEFKHSKMILVKALLHQWSSRFIHPQPKILQEVSYQKIADLKDSIRDVEK